MIDPDLLTTTCDLYRPFGASSPHLTNVPCRLTQEFNCGRAPSEITLMYDSYIDLQPGTDIVDGCTRSPGTDGPLYADGDGVRLPSGGAMMFAVVWKSWVGLGTAEDYLRVYLIRDTWA